MKGVTSNAKRLHTDDKQASLFPIMAVSKLQHWLGGRSSSTFTERCGPVKCIIFLSRALFWPRSIQQGFRYNRGSKSKIFPIISEANYLASNKNHLWHLKHSQWQYLGDSPPPFFPSSTAPSGSAPSPTPSITYHNPSRPYNRTEPWNRAGLGPWNVESLLVL